MTLFGSPSERRERAARLTAPAATSALTPAQRRAAAIERCKREFDLPRGLVCLGAVTRYIGSGLASDPHRSIEVEMFGDGRMNTRFWIRYPHDPDTLVPQFSTERPPPPPPPAPLKPGYKPPGPMFPALPSPPPEPMFTPVSW